MLKLLTPCNIINNEFGRKCFGSIDADTFKRLYFNKYLYQTRFSECKYLAYEILTVYLSENPLLNEGSLFLKEEAKTGYQRWLQMSHPEISTTRVAEHRTQ